MHKTGWFYPIAGIALMLMLPSQALAGSAWPSWCKNSAQHMAKCRQQAQQRQKVRQAKLKAIANRKAALARARANAQRKLAQQRARAKKPVPQRRVVNNNQAAVNKRLASFHKNRALYAKRLQNARKQVRIQQPKAKTSRTKKSTPAYLANYQKNRALYNKRLANARKQVRKQTPRITALKRARPQSQPMPKNLTPAQTLALLQQRQRLFNQMMAQSAGAHSAINNSINYTSTARACHVSGNCRVVSNLKH